jgi:hypothetical protein
VNAESPALSAVYDCILCANALHVPIVRLDAAAIDSVGTLISDRNVALIERIDGAYREGRYGEPGSSAAKNGALSAFIYGAITAFDFVSKLAIQEEKIYETSEEDLKHAFTTKFRNPGFYPIVNLESAKTGFGRYCLTFNIDGPPKEITVAGEMMKSWAEDVELKGKKTRVLNIDMKTFSYDRVHVVYERHSQGAIRTLQEEAGGHPLTVEAMEEITGQYIRKWGFHTVNAVTMWKTAVDELAPAPKNGAFLSSGIYFPAIKVEMPWFLPDLGFDDLRKFEYPEPLLTLDAVQTLQSRQLDWVKVKKNMRFAKWEGDGDIPEIMKKRYPDR